jgi:hypothetical protein
MNYPAPTKYKRMFLKSLIKIRIRMWRACPAAHGDPLLQVYPVSDCLEAFRPARPPDL